METSTTPKTSSNPVPFSSLSESPLSWTAEEWQARAEKMTEVVVHASTQWQSRRPTPALSAHEIRDQFRSSLPSQGAGVDSVLEEVRHLLTNCGYNGHPRWFGYITSSPDPVGVLADYLSSALNQNTNLWRIAPAATSIELQTLEWLKEIVGFPQSAEGVFSSGGQFANIIAHAVTRNTQIPWNVRESGMRRGLGSEKEYCFYVSNQAHYCHAQALDLLGFGSNSLRLVPVDAHYRMNLEALAQMVSEDREQGRLPLSVIATAGTVGVGAVDPIRELREFTNREGLWFHVDGAYGAPGVLAPESSEDLRAIATADSLAFDPHKWLYSPLDAGVTFIRKPGLLPQSFGNQVSYLDQRQSQNGILDFVNYTPENSRPFRALKVWMALKAHGREGFSQLISRDFQLARLMKAEIEKTPELEIAAPVETSIVCWRVIPPQALLESWTLEKLNELQVAILEEVEKRGIALLSKAVLQNGVVALRACFVNFRTTDQDVILTVSASRQIGLELAESFLDHADSTE